MQTTHLDLPLLAAGQAQKHVTHNDALLMLDDLVQLAIVEAPLAAPPSAPDEGDRYIVAPVPIGNWSDRAGEIAVWRDQAWTFYSPRSGWQAVEATTGIVHRFDGTTWQITAGFPLLGVNSTADAQNRLTVSSSASLFNHAGSDHRIKVNKAAPANTASVLFQSAFSGRAEIGLNGSDGLSFKTSTDGVAWQDAIRIEPNGVVSFPTTPFGTSGVNLLINGDFAINQRVFAGGALALDAFGYDRWKAAASGTSVTVSAGVVALASGAIQQVIEPAQWGFANFAGQALTVSVEQPSAAMEIQIGGVTAVIPQSSGRASVTVTVPSSFTGAPALRLARSGAGAINFRRIKLELGSSATPWIARPLTQEQLLAQRYYYRINGPISLFLYAQSSGNYFFNSLALPVPMRATPAVTRTLGTSGNIFQNDLTNATAAGLSTSAVRLSVRANAAGECYANFDRVECTAEL